MPGKKLLGSQVKHLLSGVSDHGLQHLAEVETDLVQTALLLGEAIEKLGASFIAIHAAVTAQHETIDLLLSGQTPAADYEAKLKKVQGEIGNHVNAAVTGLQFQDLTSQLIDRTVRRVAGLREFLGTLGSGGAGMFEDSDSEQVTQLLSRINEALAVQHLQLKGVLHKAVQQNDMGSGAIELF
ncbi:chemotaxis protein [Undibacterium arcticum]|uniref:Chemotaxis protein n=1 Tax=Undibacterium arcticum TaxID=1762892 RepID=A0ABV7F6D4_9BURK